MPYQKYGLHLQHENKQDVEQLIYGKMKKTRALTQSEYNKINNLYNKYRDGLLKIANDENIDMFIRADISRNLEKLSLPNQIYWNGKC